MVLSMTQNYQVILLGVCTSPDYTTQNEHPRDAGTTKQVTNTLISFT